MRFVQEIDRDGGTRINDDDGKATLNAIFRRHRIEKAINAHPLWVRDEGPDRHVLPRFQHPDRVAALGEPINESVALRGVDAADRPPERCEPAPRMELAL